MDKKKKIIDIPTESEAYIERSVSGSEKIEVSKEKLGRHLDEFHQEQFVLSYVNGTKLIPDILEIDHQSISYCEKEDSEAEQIAARKAFRNGMIEMRSIWIKSLGN
jgi:hypothetical protein